MHAYILPVLGMAKMNKRGEVSHIDRDLVV
jgi:hypothetical protein